MNFEYFGNLEKKKTIMRKIMLLALFVSLRIYWYSSVYYQNKSLVEIILYSFYYFNFELLPCLFKKIFK